MTSSTKTLTLLEQKRIQWAREREEMVGLYGLWGHPKYRSDSQKPENYQLKRNNALPPIPARSDTEKIQKGNRNFRPEEESETSGYLSDSPKHLKETETVEDNRYKEEMVGSDWYDKGERSDNYTTDNTAEEYSMDRKSYKNYRNEKWAQQSSDMWHPQRGRNSRNWWYGTPESISSDDGNRPKWGDRGVGIGHFWEPVIHQPDSRLPQLESYRPTPRWVERGLRQADGSQNADILIIHHPDDDQYKNYSSDCQTPKNFLLGQNVRLTPDVLEERERKRKRALEHQNAIRQQLEDRERKRKEERQNKLREERLEEERIKREQETERLRLEEELRRNREKEEKEKRKEELMKEAIERAEKKAMEDKRHQRRHVHPTIQEEDLQKKPEAAQDLNKKCFVRTPKQTKDDSTEGRIKMSRTEKANTDRQSEVRPKTRKDSSSQFEQMRMPNGVQFLNMNKLPMDGSLALVLDNPQPENNFLLPSDGVQLALLMSPGNVGSSQLFPIPTPMPTAVTPRERVLTPSKFRYVENSPLNSQRDKSIQTDGICCSKSARVPVRSRKQNRQSGRISGCSDSSEKSNSLERPRAHYHCTTSTKHRSRSQPKYTIDDRPKWGINRPSVQYKKQSEKDLYYQKRIRQKLKKVNDVSTSIEASPKLKETQQIQEKLLESEMRLLKCDSDDEESESKKATRNDDIVLRNGYRMNSNPSSPLFAPIETDRTAKSDEGQEFVLELTVEPELVPEDATDESRDEDTAVPGSVGFVTQTQLEAIKQIASLKEGLQKLQKDFSSSRSITPYSDKNDN